MCINQKGKHRLLRLKRPCACIGDFCCKCKTSLYVFAFEKRIIGKHFFRRHYIIEIRLDFADLTTSQEAEQRKRELPVTCHWRKVAVGNAGCFCGLSMPEQFSWLRRVADARIVMLGK